MVMPIASSDSNANNATSAEQLPTADLHAVEQHLQQTIDTITRAQHVRESARLVEAHRLQRLTYPSQQDIGLARLHARLCVDLDEAQMLLRVRSNTTTTTTPALQVHSFDRAVVVTTAIKEEPQEVPTGYDTDDTVDETFVIDMDNRDGHDDGWAPKTETKPAQDPAISFRENSLWFQLKDIHCEVSVESAPPVSKPQSLAQRAAASLALAHELEGCQARSPARLMDLLRLLEELVVDLDAGHSKNRARPISAECVNSMVQACELALDRLLETEMVLDLVQPVLGLQKTMRVARHRDLKRVFASPLQVLHGVTSALPETVSGMPRTCRSVSRDGVAQECFTLAIDLYTTTDASARPALIGHVLRNVKANFKPSLVLRPQHKKSRRSKTTKTKGKEKWTVPWAGRVLLVVLQIVAYTIGFHVRDKTDRMESILQVVGARHPLFPALLERAHAMLAKPNTHINPRALDLHREVRRVQEICSRVCSMQTVFF